MSRAPRLLLAALVLITAQPAFAQMSSPAPRPQRKFDTEEFYRAPNSVHGKTIVVPINTTWEGKLDTTLSSEHSRAGTAFNIVMTSPVMLNGTEVIVPAGSKILGEVVEAVPASHVPRSLGQPKYLVRGKLRIQISGLQTPDGITHPLVASVAGDVNKNNRYNDEYEPPQGITVGYVGDAASFEAVNPSRAVGPRRGFEDRRPNVVGKREFYKDPILGIGEDQFKKDHLSVRALVLKKRDYYIYAGSALMVRLKAPFKMSIGSPGMGVPVGTVQAEVDDQLPPPTRATSSPSFDRGGGGNAMAGRGGGFSSPPPSQNSAPADSF